MQVGPKFNFLIRKRKIQITKKIPNNSFSLKRDLFFQRALQNFLKESQKGPFEYEKSFKGRGVSHNKLFKDSYGKQIICFSNNLKSHLKHA